MSPDIFQKALLATARVACCAALLSCTARTEAPPKTSDTASPPATEAKTPELTLKPLETAPVSAPVSAPSTEPSLASCQAHVQGVFVAKTTPQSDLTKECCQQVARSIPFDQTSSWAERDECCSLLGWNGSMACTPWGPPTPPAMRA